jgi:hypothetical protein
MNADQEFVGFGRGLLDVLDLKDVGRSVFGGYCGFHEHGFAAWQPPLVGRA